MIQANSSACHEFAGVPVYSIYKVVDSAYAVPVVSSQGSAVYCSGICGIVHNCEVDEAIVVRAEALWVCIKIHERQTKGIEFPGQSRFFFPQALEVSCTSDKYPADSMLYSCFIHEENVHTYVRGLDARSIRGEVCAVIGAFANQPNRTASIVGGEHFASNI